MFGYTQEVLLVDMLSSVGRFIEYKLTGQSEYRLMVPFEGARTVNTDLEGKLVPSGPGTVNYKALPASGWTPEQVRAELEKLGSMEHTRWEDGRVSGATSPLTSICTTF